jgi:hypothetical protein
MRMAVNKSRKNSAAGKPEDSAVERFLFGERDDFALLVANNCKIRFKSLARPE